MANASLAANTKFGAAVSPPGVTIQAVALADVSGNLIATSSNGDGTSNLVVDAAIVIEPSSAAVTSVLMTGSNQIVSAVAKDYRGFTVRETAGAPAVMVIWDNASAASGTPIDEVTLAANESAREFYPEGGVRTTNGIYVQIVSGAIAGSIRTAV